MDIHIMVTWQLSKRVSADQCHMTVSWASSVQVIKVTYFFKVIRWPAKNEFDFYNVVRCQAYNSG